MFEIATKRVTLIESGDAIVINADDFDPRLHKPATGRERLVEPEAPVVPTPTGEVEPMPEFAAMTLAQLKEQPLFGKIPDTVKKTKRADVVAALIEIWQQENQ